MQRRGVGHTARGDFVQRVVGEPESLGRVLEELVPHRLGQRSEHVRQWQPRRRSDPSSHDLSAAHRRRVYHPSHGVVQAI